jgi:adenosine deaminase/aminodeoxyfutalosine deaminase
MFHTSLVGEYELAQDLFEFTDEHLRELARNSFEASFLPADKKVKMLQQFDRQMELMDRTVQGNISIG